MKSSESSLCKLFGAAALALLLTACGGGGGGGSTPPPPPPPPANQPPVASFTSASTVQAGVPLVVNASASNDPDNDPLTYSWDFGNGSKGGGVALAHVFTAAGDFTITLTVADSRGASTSTQRTVAVSAGPAAGAPATLQTLVSDGTGPLAGVTISVVGGTATAATGADGKANINTATGVPQQLKFSKAGYADQFKSINLPTGGTGAMIEVRMLAREAPLTLADAAAGGTLTGKDGAVITIPANALVDAAGNPVTGAVQVNVTPVNVGANPAAFPGMFQGFQPTGARGLIASYGTVEYVLTRNGAPVQLAPGRKATIEIPVYTSLNLDGSDVTAGAVIPLWSLDERTAMWIQEGSGTVVANPNSPSALAMRAEVGHFSWWNCDQWLGQMPNDSYNPNTRCCIRDTPNGPCKENSGDVCNVSGSPNQSTTQQAMSAWVRPFNVNPSTRRIPTTVATATVPALAGGVLPMPSNLDIGVVASARNGTYRGTRTFRGGRGVSETVIVDLLPVAGGGNNDPITLPWDQVYSMAAAGEVDRFRLAMPVGAGFELRVAPSGSQLAGTVRVTRPDASVVASLPFSASSTAYVAEATVAAAGDYVIEITAGSGAPGAYRLEAVSFGACSSTESLPIPASPIVSLSANQSRCFDLALAADEAIQIDIGQTQNGINGSVSLSTAGGVQVLDSRVFPSLQRILTGVSMAGNYRLRVTNRTLASGTVALTISKPAVEILSVPDSRSGIALGALPKLYLVKPPADGLFHLMLSTNGSAQLAGQFYPSQASFTVSGTSARVTRAGAAPGLPVVLVARNSGGTAADTVTVATGAPTVIARDSDINGTLGSAPAVYAFDAGIGEEIAFALARPEASPTMTAFDVYAPSGARLGNNSTVHALAESGAHTALVSSISGTGNPYTFRVNNAPAPIALTLTSPVTPQTADLPLGQVLRYTFDLAQGDLVGVSLATTGPLAASAFINGVPNAAIATPTAGTGPFAVASPPRFVNSAGNYVLSLRSTSGALERARGNVTLGVVRPTPIPTGINAPVTATLAFNQWVSYRYTVPAGGRYLLRLATSAPAPYALAGTVWAPSSIFTGYTGEFSSSLSSQTSTEGLGLLAAGNHTVTVQDTLNASGARPFTMTLVNLEEPVALTLGSAPIAGTIDSDGERDYFSFAGIGGQAYTVRVNAAFAGTVRVRKLNPNGDFTNRGFMADLGGTPLTFANGVERVVSFTIPNDAGFGSGTYIVEVVADANATGDYTVRVTSP